MRVVIEYEIGYMACFIVYPRPLERPNVLGDVLSSGEGRKGLMGRKLSWTLLKYQFLFPLAEWKKPWDWRSLELYFTYLSYSPFWFISQSFLESASAV